MQKLLLSIEKSFLRQPIGSSINFQLLLLVFVSPASGGVHVLGDMAGILCTITRLRDASKGSLGTHPFALRGRVWYHEHTGLVLEECKSHVMLNYSLRCNTTVDEQPECSHLRNHLSGDIFAVTSPTQWLNARKNTLSSKLSYFYALCSFNTLVVSNESNFQELYSSVKVLSDEF